MLVSRHSWLQVMRPAFAALYSHAADIKAAHAAYHSGKHRGLKLRVYAAVSYLHAADIKAAHAAYHSGKLQ